MMRTMISLTFAAVLAGCHSTSQTQSETSATGNGITCMAFWSGYRIEDNQCVRRGTSGCSNPFKFVEEKDCQDYLAAHNKYEISLSAGGFLFHHSAHISRIAADGGRIEIANLICKHEDVSESSVYTCANETFRVTVATTAFPLHTGAELVFKKSGEASKNFSCKQVTPAETQGADMMQEFLRCDEVKAVAK